MEEYWFRASMSRLEISSASFFFSETLHDNLQSRCTGQATKSIDKENYFVQEGDRVTPLDVHADWRDGIRPLLELVR